jgi:hypothetical protein
MKKSRLVLGFSLAIAFGLCAVAFLGQSTGPLLADGAVAPQSFQGGNVTIAAKNATPLTRVAACLPEGSSCSKGSDCCSGSCLPQHSKCGR